MIDFFAPTDFFGPFVMEILEDALLGDHSVSYPVSRFWSKI